MPIAVTELQNEVDRVAGTARWVRGAEGLVERLASTGFDFHSDAATILALNGVADADDSTLVALIDQGAPLNVRLQDLDPASQSSELAGNELLRDAIHHGKVGLFEALLARGWQQRLGRREASIVFARGAAGCNPAMVDAAASSGLDIDVLPPWREQAGWHDDEQGAALANLASTYQCRDEQARVATAERLLALGADPNQRNAQGYTSIYGVENLELLNLLLARGADPRVLDRQGNSQVFGSWTDAIVLRLLEAGASPVGRYYDGRTLHEQTRERNMPRTAAWLAAHPSASAPRP